MDVAFRIRALRIALGMSQADLAHRVGVSPNVPGLWERGVQRPGYDALVVLPDVLGTSGDYLLCRTDDPRPVGDGPAVSLEALAAAYLQLAGEAAAGTVLDGASPP